MTVKAIILHKLYVCVLLTRMTLIYLSENVYMSCHLYEPKKNFPKAASRWREKKSKYISIKGEQNLKIVLAHTGIINVQFELYYISAAYL